VLGSIIRRTRMDEDVFNLQIRKFLKKVGITCQREIEKAVREAVASGKLAGSESLPVAVTLELAAVNIHLKVDGEIALE
jgi:hypothetical protein